MKPLTLSALKKVARAMVDQSVLNETRAYLRFDMETSVEAPALELLTLREWGAGQIEYSFDVKEVLDARPSEGIWLGELDAEVKSYLENKYNLKDL